MDWDFYKTCLADHLTASWQELSIDPPNPQNICTDSRSIKKGDFFVPIIGERFDGHKFIDSAMKQGASCFLYSDSRKDMISPNLLDHGISVSDTLVGLQAIARGWLRKVAPRKIIAITGSVGKTTAKEMINHICVHAGKTHATSSSFNNEIGVPLTILKAAKDTEYLILEFGARHQGDIAFLCEMTTPTIAVVLNTKLVHVGEFGGFEKLVQTKTEMYRHSAKDATLIAPYEDPNLVSMAAATGKKVVTFGLSEESDISVTNTIWQGSSSMRIDLTIDQETLKVQLNAAHESYPINAAAAAAIAKVSGVTNSSITEGLKKFLPASGRFQISIEGDKTIVNDSYNASPESMLSAFKTLKNLYQGSSIALVLGDMKELGDISKSEHIAVTKEAVNHLNLDIIICIGEYAEYLAQGATEQGLAKDKILTFSDVNELLAVDFDIFTNCDVIFLKASNSLSFNKLIDPIKQWSQNQ